MATGPIRLFERRVPTAKVDDLISVCVDLLGECGWQLSDWDRWLLSRQLVPVVRALRRRRTPDSDTMDALFDLLAAMSDRYDIDELDSALRSLLAARSLVERESPIREEEA